ncbi:MAG TPA: hypothetical protein VH373_20690 [Jatrophihabitantaceae bacterium]|jgi:hypothetical protein
MDASPAGDPRTEEVDPRSEEEERLLVLASVVSAVVTAVEAVRQDVQHSLGRSPAPPPAWSPPDVVIGLLVGATSRATTAGTVVLGALRPVAAIAVRPPLLPERLHPITWIQATGRQGRAYRSRVDPLLQTVVPSLVAAILDRIDIGAIVARLDIGAIVAQVDIDSIVANVDIDAVLARIDMASIAREVVYEIDLPEIIRVSTGIVTSEAVVGVRMQGIQADERVNRIVDRILARRGARKTAAPTPTGADNGAPN